MAFDKYFICNLALTRLGQTEIDSFEDGTKSSKLCKLHYPFAVDYLLETHPWNFAEKNARLAKKTRVPDDFDYAYQLPNDLIRAYGISGTGGIKVGAEYKIRQGELVANEDPIYLRYTARVAEQYFTAGFINALDCELAARLCIPINENDPRSQAFQQMARVALLEAKSRDSQADTPEYIDSFPLIVAHNAG